MHDTTLLATLVPHLRDIVHEAIHHAPPTPALVLSDAESPLSRLLAAGYRAALPEARHLLLDQPPAVYPLIEALPPGALVVLIESTRFDFGEVRFRLDLFRRGLAVIEHPHLARISAAEIPIYVDALAYDPAYFRGLGDRLKGYIDGAAIIEIQTEPGTLRYQGPFEPARRNVGDYAGLATVGGQFPIGEVFTEPVDLDGVDGIVTLAAFADQDYSVTFPDAPFPLTIAAGKVTGAPGAPAAFAAILEDIARREGEVRIRELGFGINRALSFTHRVTDAGTFERMCGVHLSLGSKHAVYPKRGYNRKRTHVHLDVYCATEQVVVDGVKVFAGGAWVG